jgi:uncharacterized membrane protein YfcA
LAPACPAAFRLKMITDPWFYAAAIPAILVLGLSKGGFTAIGLLMVPIMALAVSPVRAAGITLPVLVLSDIVAVIAYWGVYDAVTLKTMLPGALMGIAAGWLAASSVNESFIRLIVGLISIVFAIQFFLAGKRQREPRAHNIWQGTFWGMVAGFTSFVSHSGGPPYQVYVAPLRQEPALFAGTSVIFFALVNAFKVVPYFYLGQFDRENLITAAILVPLAIPTTLLAVWLVKRFDPKRFYNLIYGTILIVGIYLVAESVPMIV